MASDLAKGFDVPIIHVNADDVRGLHQRLSELAFALPPGVRPRTCSIDLIGLPHASATNEADEAGPTRSPRCTR